MLKMLKQYEVRIEVHRAAAKYHGALAEYASALHLDTQSQRRKEMADKCISAAGEYRVRLLDLLDYAFTTGLSEVGEQEIQRTRKYLELLDVEMGYIRKMSGADK